MSKLNQEALEESVAALLEYSLNTKKRNFTETIELQIGLKNYDHSKDKRFAGTVKLPNTCRHNATVCVLGDQVHCDEAAALGMNFLSVEDMKGFKKNKKKVKQLAASYDAFLASETLIRQIPRLLGPGLNKAGKFPSIIRHGDSIEEKVDEFKCSSKFQLKKVVCLNVPIGDVTQDPEAIAINVTLALNFLVTMLKKHWQNLKSVHIKSTMGPSQNIF